MKRPAIHREIYAMLIIDKGSVSKIYKEFYKSISERMGTGYKESKYRERN